MEDLLREIIREKNRRIKDLKEEIYFLRDELFLARGGTFEVQAPAPASAPEKKATPETMAEEPVDKTEIDSFVRCLLEDS